MLNHFFCVQGAVIDIRSEIWTIIRKEIERVRQGREDEREEQSSKLRRQAEHDGLSDMNVEIRFYIITQKSAIAGLCI